MITSPWPGAFEDNGFYDYHPITHLAAEARTELGWSLYHPSCDLTRENQVLAQRVILLVTSLEKANDTWHKQVPAIRAKALNKKVVELDTRRYALTFDSNLTESEKEKHMKERTSLQKSLEGSFFGVALPIRFPEILEEANAVLDLIDGMPVLPFGFDKARSALTSIRDLSLKSTRASVQVL